MTDQKRLIPGDAVRHINGRFGYVNAETDDGFLVVSWSDGQTSEPIRPGYLEKVKSGLTILGR